MVGNEFKTNITNKECVWQDKIVRNKMETSRTNKDVTYYHGTMKNI